jgi:hypothetical protein
VHLHLGELEAHAADLDLEVVAPGDLDQPCAETPAEVAGAVPAPAVVDHELLGGELGALEVAAREAAAGELDLADDADRDALAEAVDDPHRHVLERPPDEGLGDREVARGR